MTKKWAGQEWAQRDLNVVVAFLMLLLLGVRWRVFIPISLGLFVLAVAFVVARRKRRERKWEKDPSEFWADRLK